MATVGHTTIGFQPELFDLGHMRVVWDTVYQAPVQDPYIGGQNVYGSGDVFQDSGGNTYRVSTPDGTVTALYQASPAPVGQTPQNPGNQQGHDPSNPSNSSPYSPNNPANPNSPNNPNSPINRSAPGAQTGAAVAGGLGSLTKALGSPLRIGSGAGAVVLPIWTVLAGVGGLYMLSQKKRR